MALLFHSITYSLPSSMCAVPLLLQWRQHKKVLFERHMSDTPTTGHQTQQICPQCFCHLVLDGKFSIALSLFSSFKVDLKSKLLKSAFSCTTTLHYGSSTYNQFYWHLFHLFASFLEFSIFNVARIYLGWLFCWFVFVSLFPCNFSYLVGLFFGISSIKFWKIKWHEQHVFRRVILLFTTIYYIHQLM